MKELKQFILRNGKRPIDYRDPVKGAPFSPEAWLDYETATALAQGYGEEYGVGFVFTESDPYFFLDIDHMDEKPELTQSLLSMFPGCLVEVSLSGNGLHVFGRYDGLEPEHACKNTDLGIELYTSHRFVALTGNEWPGGDCDTVTDLRGVIAQYFRPTERSGTNWTESPVEEWVGPSDDAELIRRAAAAKTAASSFGGLTFTDLFECNVEKLAARWPHESKAYDESSADAALASHLAFWTGGDCERMRRIMESSSLVRPKWGRADYLERTILNACAACTKYYKETPRATVEAPPVGKAQISNGVAFMQPKEQLEYFKGCVYIADHHAVATPAGQMLKPDRFRALYGGWEFAMDSGAGSKTTKNAFEVFTESQAVRFPKADTSEFKPRLPSGGVRESDGLRFFNTWRPVDVARAPGGVSKFLTHMEKLIPNEGDRGILLAYLAAVVQFQGIKFQWAPLIQGAEGNGKTLFTHVLAEAVGWKYTHIPDADKLGEKFNSWIYGKTFCGIEDVYIQGGRVEVMEKLKPLITNRRIEIEHKGKDVMTVEQCANFVFNSNHKDAITKTENDRRFAVFYTAQQTADDIKRDGMGVEYFSNLYDWLRHGGGYAAVTDYLYSYSIPEELNPANGHRAPKTSSTEEAVRLSKGRVEQEVEEAIAEGRMGFRAPWVSSIAFGELLDSMRIRLSHQKRAVLLESLGYIKHPGLTDGRTNDPTRTDGRKTRLFVLKDHIEVELKGKSVADRYDTAQESSLDQVFGVAK